LLCRKGEKLGREKSDLDCKPMGSLCSIRAFELIIKIGENKVEGTVKKRLK
jgi:hypothetical protein